MKENSYEYKNLFLTIGLKVSYYRKLKGLSQEELAEKINMSTTFVGMIEAPNLYKAPSLSTLHNIAVVLEVPVYKLLQAD